MKLDQQLPASSQASETGNARELQLRLEAFLSLKSDTTARTYRGIIRSWCAFLEEKSGQGSDTSQLFTQATDLHATLYRDWLQKRPGQNIHSVKQAETTEVSKSNQKISRDGYQSTLSNATISKHFAALRRIYRMLMSYDFGIERNPFDPERIGKIASSAGQKRPTEMIPFDKVQEIVNSPDTQTPKGIRDRAILALLFGGGLRRSEVVKLRIGDIKHTQKNIPYLHLRATKAGKDAYQSLPDWAISHLQALIDIRLAEKAQPQDFLFISYRGKGGNTPTIHPLSDNGLYRLFKSYCKIAGVKDRVSPHSARATAITRLLEHGIPHRDVQEFSRHSSVQMVEVYDKRRAGIEQNPARKLDYS